MFAITGTVPTGHDEQFGFEIKWDGVRLIAYVQNGGVRGFTRNDRDVTSTYPELSELAEAFPAQSVVLDGELVAFNKTGAVDFGTLQQRMHITKPADVARLQRQVPIVYVVFDVLALNGTSTLAAPYRQRRELLESLEITAPHIQVPPLVEGNVEQALAVSRHMRAEGIIAKKANSTYQPGRRSGEWIKIKHFRTQEVVIGGWRPGTGNREGRIGSLLLGIPTAHGLRYCGRCGTGFNETTLTQLTRLLQPLALPGSPFEPAPPSGVRRDAHWVRPTLVGEVSFAGWTIDGILRQPSWRGLRSDKKVSEIIMDTPS